MRTESKHKFLPTIEQCEEMDDLSQGWCIACGETQDGCEPDMREGTCESCGVNQVYGGAELVIMDLVR